MLYLYVRLMMLGFSFNTVLLHLVSVLFWTSTECGWLTAEIVSLPVFWLLILLLFLTLLNLKLLTCVLKLELMSLTIAQLTRVSIDCKTFFLLSVSEASCM